MTTSRRRSRRDDRPRRHELAGLICSAGFASGHRFVVGHWSLSPVGPVTDVMWARPDHGRVLLVDRPQAAAFITAVYRFDRVEVVPIQARQEADAFEVEAGEVHLSLRGGRRWPLPLGRWRPAWFTRWVEGMLARALLGVRTYGVSPTGVREWYRADEYRRVTEAQASMSGRDLGALSRRVTPPVRFGFTGPPRRPSMVKVRPLLVDPSGRLDRVVDDSG